MTLLYCVDNNNGLMFNGRRQSRDKVLLARILERTKESRLWVVPYSAKLFGSEAHIQVAEDPVTRAGEGEFCFVEDWDPGLCQSLPEQVIRFCWNRDYPADLWCTLDLTQYTLTQTEEFAGSSHEKITEEIFTR